MYFSTILTVGVGVGVALLLLVKRKFVESVIRTIPRDLMALNRFILVHKDLWYYQKKNYTIAKAFDDTVKRNPKKVLLKFENQSWTAEEIQKLSNKVGNYFQSLGFKKGDTVCVFMENTAEYVSMWLGLSRIGCITSLVNYNLRLKPLQHCFEAVNCKAIIYSPGLSHALEELLDLGGLSGIPLFFVGNESSEQLQKHSKDLLRILQGVSDSRPIVKESLGFFDNLIYIYTSGTTGLPKAATIKQFRFLMVAVGGFYTHGLDKKDVLYTPLPLYHGSGTMMGTGTMLTFGVTQVVRQKFSASNFWKDCILYEVTAAQYIGEICRYLLAQPLSSVDSAHKVRVMFGNGLKAEIWKDFVTRFNISHISELYGATEGNCNMVNIDDRIGAVGFTPVWLPTIIPIQIIKVDEETGNPIRDKNGRVILCKTGEGGEMIGRIKRNHPISDFEGYADKNSSKDKILYDAFKKGDSWFRSGDILMRDELGYFYFKDRKGDTFRWKGENCSTAEVEAVISNSTSNLQDCVVFGVEVPGNDGRAGMAVISDPDNEIDMDKIGESVKKSLPSYARPIFIRVTPKLEMTGTYKLKKTDYQKVGFDISKTNDRIFFLEGSKYVPLIPELYGKIISGTARV